MNPPPTLPMRTLRAGSSTLEPQRAAHAAEMFAVLADPAIYEFENAAPVSEQWLAERYARLEARASPDGATLWLNWVVRLETGELCGYVQATVLPTGDALVAYEFGSRFWRRGIGSAAVATVLDELVDRYAVRTAVAVLKTANHRSAGLLRHLGFSAVGDRQRAVHAAEADESVMARALRPADASPRA